MKQDFKVYLRLLGYLKPFWGIAILVFVGFAISAATEVSIAKLLEKEIPSSDWAQVSLFKFHLEKNEGDKASAAMLKILGSAKIDRKIKHRVFNEFLIFARKNPVFAIEIEKAIPYFKSDSQLNVAKEVGKFYQNKQDWPNAVKYYELFTNSNPEDLENILLLMNGYVHTNQFSILLKKSESYLELYPLQPDFYYYAGLANNQLKNYKKAKEQLEIGLYYLI